MWKQDRPKTPGYYWIKNDKYEFEIKIVSIIRDSKDALWIDLHPFGWLLLDDARFDLFLFSKEIKPPK